MGKLSGLLVLGFTGFNIAFAETLPVQDNDFGCIDSATANQYVQDFHINVSSFGGLELCRAQVDTKKLFNDLTVIEKGLYDESKRHPLIRDFIHPRAYFSWMKQMTRGIRRGHDIPYATAYNSGGFFTMAIVTGKQIGRAHV